MFELLPRWDAGASVDTDLRSLEDQMKRCNRSDNPRFRLSYGMGRLLGFLRQHLVTLVVLLALLSAVLSAAG